MTKTYSLRMDENTRDAAKKVFDNLGMDFSTGIRIYLRQVIKTNGIPFDVTNNVSSLDRSLQEYQDGNYQTFDSVDDLFNDLDDKADHNEN